MDSKIKFFSTRKAHRKSHVFEAVACALSSVMHGFWFCSKEGPQLDSFTTFMSELIERAAAHLLARSIMSAY